MKTAIQPTRSQAARDEHSALSDDHAPAENSGPHVQPTPLPVVEELVTGDTAGWRRLLFPLGCSLCGVISLVWLDYPIGSYFAAHPLEDAPARLLDAAEHFGTPFGQILILFGVGAFHHWWEPRIIRLFAGGCAGGIAADIVKLLVARERPRVFDFTEQTIWQGFQGLFPFGSGGSALQSFPSAHTATAFGFAVTMAWAFPRAANYFWGLAVLVGLHRITCAAHFPSDVCLGAAVGYCAAQILISQGRIGRAFTGWERRLGRTQT